MKNWMISITRKQSWSYIIVVGKIIVHFNDVSMLGYGCDVSQYPYFYDQEWDKYQLLPHPYLNFGIWYILKDIPSYMIISAIATVRRAH